jgi:hypothetical protein
MARKADIITTELHGLWSFVGNTRRGRAWLHEWVSSESPIWGEHRQCYAIAIAALQDGLRLQDAATGRFARLPTELAEG